MNKNQFVILIVLIVCIFFVGISSAFAVFGAGSSSDHIRLDFHDAHGVDHKQSSGAHPDYACSGHKMESMFEFFVAQPEYKKGLKGTKLPKAQKTSDSLAAGLASSKSLRDDDGVKNGVSVWRSTGAVIFVLGALLSVNAYLKKRQGFGFKKRSSSRIKIVERAPFDSRRSFVLLEAEGRKLLIGAGTDGFETLVDFGAAAEMESESGGVEQTSNFEAWQKSMGKNDLLGSLRVVSGSDGE